MKRAIVERNIVIVLFVMVLVTFSFAERDSKKLEKLYASVTAIGSKIALQTKNLVTLNTHPVAD